MAGLARALNPMDWWVEGELGVCSDRSCHSLGLEQKRVAVSVVGSTWLET